MTSGTSSALLLLLAGCASADYRTACENSVEGDACQYVSNKGTCCSMIAAENGDQEKFCRECEIPGAITSSTCGIHSRQGYLGCFSRKEDAAVFQVCVGMLQGSDCMYETAASTRGGGTPASNTTGHCIAHYSHQQVMCLEAIGQPDDEECAGKAVGMPCTHSESANALCAHHSRRGNWMCLAPMEESMVFVVCQGAASGTPCSYTGSGSHGQASGSIIGECQPHSGHGGMMCMNPDELAAYLASIDDSSESEEVLGMKIWVIAVVASCGFIVLISIAVGTALVFHLRKRPAAPASKAGKDPVWVIGQVADNEHKTGTNLNRVKAGGHTSP